MAIDPRNNGSNTEAIPEAIPARRIPPVEHQFKPGNPGRPKGSRNKLGEEFISKLCADFEQHGVDAIVKVREKRPHEYLKVIASILPKELHVKDATLGEMTDEELVGLLASIRSLTAADHGAAAGERDRVAPPKKDSVPARRPN